MEASSLASVNRMILIFRDNKNLQLRILRSKEKKLWQLNKQNETLYELRGTSQGV